MFEWYCFGLYFQVTESILVRTMDEETLIAWIVGEEQDYENGDGESYLVERYLWVICGHKRVS